MGIVAKTRKFLTPMLQRHSSLKEAAIDLDNWVNYVRHTAARRMPSLIRPTVRTLCVAITADCNQRCLGCLYGREYMAGQTLPLDIVKVMLDDAKRLGFWNIIFYGGEPLLHPDLTRMVEHAAKLDFPSLIVTNGILLKKRIDDLYSAGARNISMGFYGCGEEYDAYVQRRGNFNRLIESIDYVRQTYGQEIKIGIHWLIMKPSCNLKVLENVWTFARTHAIDRFNIDLIQYSLPYFNEGPGHSLQFADGDRNQIVEVVKELINLRDRHPRLLRHSLRGLRSIPDWLLLRRNMKIPCDRYTAVWVGADGIVQICPVLFQLGSIYEKRLPDILFNKKHYASARDCFALNCPNCHAHYDERIQKYGPARRYYGASSFEFNSPPFIKSA